MIWSDQGYQPEDVQPQPFRGSAVRPAASPRRRKLSWTSKVPASAGGPDQAATVGVGRLFFSTDLLRLSLVLLVIFAVSRVHDQYSFLAIMRLGVLLGLLVSIIGFGDPRQMQAGRIFAAWPARVIAGLGIMACLSVPFGLSVGASGKFILQGYSKVLIGAFLVIVGTRNVRDLYTLLTGFMVGGTVLAVLALFVYRAGALGDIGVVRIMGGPVGSSFDSNDLGAVACTGMAIALLMLAAGRGVIRLVGGFTALALLAAIARTGSRGGFLGLVALGIGLVVLARDVQLWKRVTLLVAAAGTLFLLAPPRYWQQIATITDTQNNYNWTAPTGRVPIWKRGLGYMRRYPLTGVGISNFGMAEGTISPLARTYVPGMPGVKWVAPHNSFIEVGAEMGVPGLVLFTTLVVGGIVGMARLQGRLPARWKQGTEEQRFLLQAPSYLAIAMIGFGVAGFFVSFAYLDLVYLLGALMSGTYFVTRQMLMAESAAVPRAPVRRSAASPA